MTSEGKGKIILVTAFFFLYFRKRGNSKNTHTVCNRVLFFSLLTKDQGRRYSGASSNFINMIKTFFTSSKL